MGGIQIIARDKNGQIKQDYEVSRDKKSGKKIEVNKLKQDERRRIKRDTE